MVFKNIINAFIWILFEVGLYLFMVCGKFDDNCKTFKALQAKFVTICELTGFTAADTWIYRKLHLKMLC